MITKLKKFQTVDADVIYLITEFKMKIFEVSVKVFLP